MYGIYELECECADNYNHYVTFEVEVTHYLNVEPHKGSAWTCDSDLDYYGYTEVDWDYYSYIITDEDGGEVDAGMGEPPCSLTLTDTQIKDALIKFIQADQDLF